MPTPPGGLGGLDDPDVLDDPEVRSTLQAKFSKNKKGKSRAPAVRLDRR